MPRSLRIAVPTPFSLAHTVCSYGYFILAPNRWLPAERGTYGSLLRPFHITDNAVVHAQIRQSPHAAHLLVTLDQPVTPADARLLRARITRMLRLDQDTRPWQKLHPHASRRHFLRLFRSPTLFEDIVKTITGCNVSWPNTINMNRLLCRQIGTGGDFPTPAELAAIAPDDLQRRCKVGYRAQRIIQLARDVTQGRLDLSWFEDPTRTTDELYAALLQIHGIGPYAAANILQLLGRYELLAVDTETVRHFAHVHGCEGDLKRITQRARLHYRRFAPYQFMAYWFELWQDYERRFGPAHRWGPKMHGAFTASKLK